MFPFFREVYYLVCGRSVVTFISWIIMKVQENMGRETENLGQKCGVRLNVWDILRVPHAFKSRSILCVFIWGHVPRVSVTCRRLTQSGGKISDRWKKYSEYVYYRRGHTSCFKGNKQESSPLYFFNKADVKILRLKVGNHGPILHNQPAWCALCAIKSLSGGFISPHINVSGAMCTYTSGNILLYHRDVERSGTPIIFATPHIYQNCIGRK